MTERDRSRGQNETAGQADRRLAGGETRRDPERLEMGRKRLHADATQRQPLATDTDDDGLNAEQLR